MANALDDQQPRKVVPLPLGILALEFFGTALLGLGFAKKLGGIDVLPIISQFDQSGWLFIGLGTALTLPFLIYIVLKVLEKAKQST